MFLPAAGFQTYQYRDAKNRFTAASQIKQSPTSTSDYVFKNWTKTIVIIFKGLPGSTTVPLTLNVGCTRKYMYKFFEDNNDYDAYN